jgi:hypothetical protein
MIWKMEEQKNNFSMRNKAELLVEHCCHIEIIDKNPRKVCEILTLSETY